VNIDFGNRTESESYQISIYDLRGEKLSSYSPGPNNNEIDVSDLPNGLYIIKSDDGKTFSRLLVSH